MRATPTLEDESCGICGAWLPTSAAAHVCVMPTNSNAMLDLRYVSPPVVAAPLSFRDACVVAMCGRMDVAGFIDDAKLAAWAFDLADAMDAERQKREAK